MTTVPQINRPVPQVFGTPIPLPSGLDRPFYEAMSAHELMVQRCECGTWQWPPEVICHRCRRFGPGWTSTTPAGTIFSWTRVWHAARDELLGAVPYVVVVVELAEAGGIRLVGNLLLDDVDTADIVVGAPVRGVFTDYEVDGREYTLLHWQPDGGVDR